jgi:hypothetical protein
MGARSETLPDERWLETAGAHPGGKLIGLYSFRVQAV